MGRVQQLYFYIHGGPGFNSWAEYNLFSPLFKIKGTKLFCWNEPSEKREEGDDFHAENAFQYMLNSCERSFLKFSEV